VGVATGTPILLSEDVMKEVIGDYEAFVRELGAGLARLGISRGEVSMMDHVCYRVGTADRYARMLEALKPYATLLGETTVSGRPIATFELNEYLEVDGWTIPFLELPAPKDGSPYEEGLEHAELVVIGSLGRFMERHAELPFKTDGLKKTINPEAGVKAEGISVKFHEQQLGAVVRIEKAVL
jgi:predicted metalloenzyme YecM